MKPQKLLYVLLLDRARLSQKNEGWVDERGRAFIFFPIKDLAETMHKSEMSVKTALAVLEKTGFDFPQASGTGIAKQIYVKSHRNIWCRRTEIFP